MVSIKRAFQNEGQARDEASGALSLNDLVAGERAQVVALSEDCQGFERRRLLDLGLSPGALVERRYQAPLGGPAAYRLRGVTLALRPGQARMVTVREAD